MQQPGHLKTECIERPFVVAHRDAVDSHIGLLAHCLEAQETASGSGDGIEVQIIFISCSAAIIVRCSAVVGVPRMGDIDVFPLPLLAFGRSFGKHPFAIQRHILA